MQRTDKSASYFASMIDYIPDALIFTDNQYKVIDWNAAAERIYGWKAEEVLGKLLNVFLQTSYQDTNQKEVIRKVKETGKWSGEVTQLRKDGTYIPVWSSVSVVKDEQDQLIGFLGINRDISDKKQAEADLRESEERYQTLAKISPVGIFRTDLNGDTTYVNPKWCEISGLSPEEALGDGWLNVVHPDDKENLVKGWQQSTQRKKISIADYRFVRPDGATVWVMGQAVPETNSENQIVGYVGTIADITERKHVEEELRESEERFRSLYENATIGLYRTTPDGKILLANPTIVKMLGYSSFEELAQRNLEQEGYEPGYERDTFRKKIDDEGAVLGLESAWTRKDGTSIFVRESVKAIRDAEGKTKYYEGTVEDITEHKRVEEELQASEAKYRSLIESSNSIIATIDIDGRFNFVNQIAASQLGGKPADIIGKLMNELFPAEVAERQLLDIQRVIENNEGLTTEAPTIVNGQERWYLNNIQPVRDSSGRAILAILNSQDITERKQAEAALRESEKRFRDLFLASPDAVMLIDPSDPEIDWPIVDCNEIACQMNGYTRDELIGKSINILNIDRETPRRRAAYLERIKRAGVLHLESFHRHRDGHIYPIEISTSVVISEGRELVLGIDRDITERKQTENALRESETRFRTLVEQVPAVTYTASIDEISTTLYISPQIEHFVGVSPDEYLNNPEIWVQQLHPEDRERVLEELHRSQASGEPFVSEYRMLSRDGHIVWFRDEACVVQDDDGKALFIQGLLFDITERKQADDELKRQKELLQTIVDNIPVMIAFINPEGHTQWINQQWEHVLGWSLEDATERDILVELYPDPQERQRVIDFALRGEGTWEDFRTHVRDGRVIDTSWANIVLSDGTSIGIGQDISERKFAEQKLQESEHTLKLFVEYAPAAIAMFDRDMKYIAASHRYITDYHLPDENIIGRSHYEVFPEIPERWKEIHQRCLAGATEKTEEDPFLRADGSLDWVRWEIHPWYKAGEIGGIVLFSEVITERKQAKEAVIESERQMRALVTSLDDIVFEFDEQGTYLNVWTADESLLAQPKAQLLGQRIEEVMGEKTGRPLAEAVKRVLASEHSESMEYSLEVTGGQRCFLARISPILIQDKQDEPSKTVSIVIRDITERKEAEEALRENEIRFRSLIENSSDEISIITADGKLLYESPTANPTLGYPSGEFLGHNLFQLIHPDDLERVQDQFARIIQDPDLHPRDQFRLRHQNGNWRWVEAVGTNLLSEPSVRGIVVNYHDITERKQAEEQVKLQLKRMRALSEIDRAIASSLDMRLSLDILLSEVLSQLNVDAASVLLLDGYSHSLEYVAGKGFRSSQVRQSRMRLGDGLAGKVGLERKSLHLPNLDEAASQFKRAELFKEEKFVEYFGVPLIAKGQLKGVLEVFHRAPLEPDPEWMNYLKTLGRQAAIAIDNVQLFEGMQHSNLELITAYDATIAGWSQAMDLRDKETEGHTLRVTELTLKLAEKMGISQQEQVHVRRGALLHDIGKLGVPDHILLKPGKLTDEEWVIMRQHPVYALNMLISINYLRPALDIPYCHHEKWDGSGYPRGLKGEQIPLSARIFAIVDVWDALRSDRPYRASWSVEKTRDYILEQSGKHFDPKVVEAFLPLIENG